MRTIFREDFLDARSGSKDSSLKVSPRKDGFNLIWGAKGKRTILREVPWSEVGFSADLWHRTEQNLPDSPWGQLPVS